MKNRILKKIGTAGMAFMVAAILMGGSMAKPFTILAEDEMANTAMVEDDENTIQTSSDADGNFEDVMENDTEIVDEINDNGTIAGEPSEEELSTDTNVPETDQTNDDESHEEELESDKDEVKNGELNDENLNDEESENDQLADLNMSVSVDENPIKAGRDLVYAVMLENTGETTLKNFQISGDLGQSGLTGQWSDVTDSLGNSAYIEMLEAGSSKEIFLTVKLPEGQNAPITLRINAKADSYSEDNELIETIIRELEFKTEVTPLVASFEVSKSADRSVAVPGDKITFQICIRNTGERTLHSVVTTERFQLGNVPVEFVEQDGVVLNNTKTKARVESIAPGASVSLIAIVTLPEDLESQELLNEVSVTSQETGEKVIKSETKIQVKAAEKKLVDADGTDNSNLSENSDTTEGKKISSNPKTGDSSEPMTWAGLMVCALVIVRILKNHIFLGR